MHDADADGKVDEDEPTRLQNAKMPRNGGFTRRFHFIIDALHMHTAHSNNNNNNSATCIRAASMYSSSYVRMFMECMDDGRDAWCTGAYHVYYKPISLKSTVRFSMRRKLKKCRKRKKERKKKYRLNGPTFHVNIFSSLLCLFFRSFCYLNGDGLRSGN